MKKGQTNNPNGRPAGIPNKLTKELRNKLKNLIDVELNEVPKLLGGLEPSARLDILVKLLKFVLPTVQPISHTAGEPLNMNIFDD